MASRQESFQRNDMQVCPRATARNLTLKEEQAALWEDDRASWACDQPVTACLASHLSLVPICDARLPTATIDGHHLWFNPAWSTGLDNVARRFMQAHLVWHCATGHCLPASVSDTRRWHLACDHEVNACLLMLGIPLPPQAVLFPGQIGKPLPAVYAWLADNPLLDAELSLDVPPWHVAQPTKADPAPWQELSIKLVRRYLGTPHLPTLVASSLLGHW